MTQRSFAFSSDSETFSSSALSSESSITFVDKFCDLINCVVVPALLIVVSLFFSISLLNVKQDSVRSALHLFLVYLVPITNLFFILTPANERQRPSIAMLAALGISTGICISYAEVFLHLLLLFQPLFISTPAELIFVPGMFVVWILLQKRCISWFYRNFSMLLPVLLASGAAVFFLSLLVPYSCQSAIFYIVVSIAMLVALLIPFLPLVCLHGTWRKFREQLYLWMDDRQSAIKFAVVCVMLGAMAPFAIDGPIEITRLCSRKVSESTSEASRASIRLLDLFGDKKALVESCFESYVPNIDMCALSLSEDGKMADSHKTFYRLTGKRIFDLPKPPLKLDAPLTYRLQQYGDIEERDPYLAMQDINGVLPGLRLTNSHIEAERCKNLPIINQTWTLSFNNDSGELKEARCVIQMPRHSVLKDARIWMRGKAIPVEIKPREIAKETYRSVVLTKRDPLLITTAGPDRIFVQCYPVCFGAPLKIELSMASFLLGESSGKLPSLQPKIVDCNFEMPAHFAGTQVQSHPEDLAGAIHPELDKREIKHLYVVLDGSSLIRPMLKQVKEALWAAPRNKETTLVLASDLVSDLSPLRGVPKSSDYYQSLDDLNESYFKGGPDNLPFVMRTWQQAKREDGAAVLWIHGPQPYVYGGKSAATVAWMFGRENENATRFIDCELIPGSNKILQSLEDAYWATSRLKIESLGDAETRQEPLMNFMQTRRMEKWLVNDCLQGAVEKAVLPADRLSVEALAAKYAVEDLLVYGNVSQAITVAHKGHIVSPVTGAVAIEQIVMPKRSAGWNQPVPYKAGLDGIVEVAWLHEWDNILRFCNIGFVRQLNRLNSVNGPSDTSSSQSLSDITGQLNSLNSADSSSVKNNLRPVDSFALSSASSSANSSFHSEPMKFSQDNKSTEAALALPNHPDKEKGTTRDALGGAVDSVLFIIVYGFASIGLVFSCWQLKVQKKILARFTYVLFTIAALLGIFYANQIRDLILLFIN